MDLLVTPSITEAVEVSVVIPVLNSAKALVACLEALTVQRTSRSFEVIVVDDGSTESLTGIQTAFSGRFTMLKWIRCDQNRGPAFARNIGIERARAGIILFTDADCRPEPDWLDRLAKPFSDPAVRGAKGVYATDQEDLFARLAQLEFDERYECLAAAPSGDIDFIDTYAGAYRRADLLDVGGFDTSFSKADNEDVDLSFRIKARGGRFIFVPDAVVRHRHREGWLKYARLKFNRGYWRMRVYEKHPSKAGNDSYTPRSLKLQMVLITLLALMVLMTLISLLTLTAKRFLKILKDVISGSPILSNDSLKLLSPAAHHAFAEFSCGRMGKCATAALSGGFGLWGVSLLPLGRIAVASGRRELVPWLVPFTLTRAIAIECGMAVGLLEKTVYFLRKPLKLG
ncbi:MAG: glycosyltransferase [Candidatus Ozemobacteraceae bacterium]